MVKNTQNLNMNFIERLNVHVLFQLNEAAFNLVNRRETELTQIFFLNTIQTTI